MFDQASIPDDYARFLASKAPVAPTLGIEPGPLPDHLKHICPLPLDLIERVVRLWSNPGDTVLSPFMGIGSEGVVSLRHKRRFVGVELKETYWKQACKHFRNAEASAPDLFDAA